MLGNWLKTASIVASLFLLVPTPGVADPGPLRPGHREKCQVCGMFVAKYPGWVAQVSFGDDRTLFFDGAKDMFKFLFHLNRYMPGRNRSEVTEMYVTAYYDLRPVRAEDAFFVKGSDVFGPMGHELVPFASRADAQEFLIDHGGTSILTLGDIDPQTIGNLD